MSVLLIALPVSLVIGLISVLVFGLLVKHGQYDDLETPPQRMLFDDIDGTKKKKPAGKQ